MNRHLTVSIDKSMTDSHALKVLADEVARDAEKEGYSYTKVEHSFLVGEDVDYITAVIYVNHLQAWYDRH